MTSQAKTGSRWGSFLQQAVAGVESKLDNILADKNELQAPNSDQDRTLASDPSKVEFIVPGASSSGSADISRNLSRSGRPESLQHRLARAAVNGSPENFSSGAGLDHSTSLTTEPDSHRSSVEALPRDAFASLENSKPSTDLDPDSDIRDATLPLQVERSLGPVAGSNSLDQSKSRLRINAHSIGAVDEQGPVDDQALEGRRQLERIDALQAKVQYMAHEMALLAGKVVAESETGSSDQRMAEKDEKIALLVAEGQILSQAELNHLSIIKKLRTKLATEEKRLLSARSEANEAQKTTQALRDRVSQVELGLSESRLSAVENERRQKAVENATAESEAKTILITQLQRQLEERAMDSKSDAADKLREQLDAERNRNESQAKSLLAAETSKGLTANAQKEKLREAQNAADREKERARLTELDLRRELKVAEGRLETYLSRAEEATSDNAGESQAKLVRQIETLQNSYSVASDNWREIERALSSQISRLEREAGDSTKRETDLRRKTKESSGRCKELELELEKAANGIQDLGQCLEREKKNSAGLRTSLQMAQREVEKLSQRSRDRSATPDLPAMHTENEEESQSTVSRPSLRVFAPRSGISLDVSRPEIQARSQSGSASTSYGTNLQRTDRPMQGRTLSQPHISPIPRQSSSTSLATRSRRNSATEDNLARLDSQMAMGNVATPATPERTVNDMFSVSTTAAGPSVQLVERMSASVRRLESEKAALKEEIERQVAQRADAREQAVSLMKELESKRAADEQIERLSRQTEESRVKLATTLEMLGEKSELVEELRADIADMKEIYRSTLENAVK